MRPFTHLPTCNSNQTQTTGFLRIDFMAKNDLKGRIRGGG